MTNEVRTNPRYLKYNKDEVEDILDQAVETAGEMEEVRESLEGSYYSS